MFKWTTLPFFRFAIALIAGILFYIHSGIQLHYFYLLFSFILLYLSVFIFSYKRKIRYKLKPVFGILGLTILFFSGRLLTQLKDETNDSDHIINSSSCSYYEAIVISDSEDKMNSAKTEISVKKIKTKDGWQNASGNILLYLKKNKNISLQYGDHVLIKGSPQLISPPGNPNEFDYRKYLRFHHIHHSHFIKEKDIILIDNSPPSKLMDIAITARKNCDDIFRNNIHGENEYKIASALFLGIKSNLDNNLKEAYSATGAMHVLAVSGLHVGIILQMLMFTLGFLENKKGGKFILPIILITALWLYAFITGLSASVLRAVVMFTFLIIAKSINRRTNPYNTLALTAFLLLCYDPFFIMEVGFQLSFLAILGIVYFYPVFYRIREFKNLAADKIWAVTCVSIAAQIATFPITVFYFHQFPVYFIISNLIVIPLSFIILYSGAFLLCTFWIPFLGLATGWVVQKSIWLMNQAVFTGENLPGALVDKIGISIMETIMIYLIIAGISMLVYFKKLYYLSFTFFTLLIFFALQVMEIKIQTDQRKFIVYNIKDHHAFGFIKGNTIDLVADSSLVKDKSKLKFHITPHLRANGISNINLVSSSECKNIGLPFHHTEDYSIITFENKKFLILKREPKNYLKDKIKVDYIIANYNLKNFERIRKCFDFEKLIVHSKTDLRDLSLHNLASDRAFEIHF